MKNAYRALTLGIALLLSACAPSFESKLNDRFKAEGYDEKQIAVATQYAYRHFAAQEKGTWVVLYGRLSLKEVREKAEEFYKLLDDILSFKSPGNTKYVDKFGLGESLVKEQLVIVAVLGRVRAAEIKSDFEVLMGRVGSDPESLAQSTGYSADKIFGERDAVKAFALKDERIDAAKERGILQKSGEATWKVEEKYAKKLPIDPSKDDPNAFKWESSDVELKLVMYKIVDVSRPESNRGDYLEGYRVVRGKQESLPALRIFYPVGGSQGVLILDEDWEGKDPAFGLADIIQTVVHASVSDVIKDDALLKKIFEVREIHKRIRPPKDPIFVEIARIAPVDTWQASPDPKGWMVPFKYRLGKADNYTIKLKFVSQPAADPTSPKSALLQVEAVVKDWHGATDTTPSVGYLVEYYKPKPPFDQQNIVKASVNRFESNGKKVDFDFQGGQHEEGVIDPKKGNRFIEDEPFAIEFTEGEKRWRIEKEPNSEVFAKRKEILKTQDAPGLYTSDDLNE